MQSTGYIAVSVLAISCARTEPYVDANFVFSQPDASVNGSIDSGAVRPMFDSCANVLVAIPPRPRECNCGPREECRGGVCTLECVACSSLSPCPGDWFCDRVFPPSCEGQCRRHQPSCASIETSIELNLHEYQCRQSEYCQFRHRVDAQANRIECIILSSASCFSSSDFLSGSCVTHGAGIGVRYLNDSGFDYGTSDAVIPPEEFETEIATIFRLCAPTFQKWDGGLYRFRF
jgi:hypothetical protein